MNALVHPVMVQDVSEAHLKEDLLMDSKSIFLLNYVQKKSAQVKRK